jgi:hypothetical protein
MTFFLAAAAGQAGRVSSTMPGERIKHAIRGAIMRYLRAIVGICLVICLLGLAGCMFDDDFDAVCKARRQARENYGASPTNSGSASQGRDWCMTCGGSGQVHYVTTGQTEVCPTCHGSGIRN